MVPPDAPVLLEPPAVLPEPPMVLPEPPAALLVPALPTPALLPTPPPTLELPPRLPGGALSFALKLLPPHAAKNSSHQADGFAAFTGRSFYPCG
jgi:hypothetical protein